MTKSADLITYDSPSITTITDAVIPLGNGAGKSGQKSGEGSFDE